MLSQPSPWEFGWDALVAIGTMALAVVTMILAAATLQVARKTRELGMATTAELVANWRPVLTLVETIWLPGEMGRPSLVMEDTRIKIAVRNDGRGPALGTRAFLDVDEPAVTAPFEVGTAIAPGAYEDIGWDTGPRAPFPRTARGPCRVRRSGRYAVRDDV